MKPEFVNERLVTLGVDREFDSSFRRLSHIFSVEPRHALTPRDRAALEHWESHLVALSKFCDKVEVQ